MIKPIDFQLILLRVLVHTAMNCIPRTGPVTIWTGPTGFSVTQPLQKLTISEGILVFTTDSALIVSVVQNGGAVKESAPCQQPSLYQVVGSISPLLFTGRPSSGRFLRIPLAWILDGLRSSWPDSENSDKMIIRKIVIICVGRLFMGVGIVVSAQQMIGKVIYLSNFYEIFRFDSMLR